MDNNLEIREVKVAGHFVMTPTISYQWQDKPNWRMRFFARWLLGWIWVDYQKETER